MTSESPTALPTASGNSPLGRLRRSTLLLWSTFVLVHLGLSLLNYYGDGYPMADVTSVYKFWVDQGLSADYWVGIDAPWVYPVVAIVPMLVAHSLYPVVESIPAIAWHSFGPGLFASTWLSMIMLLDAVALAALTGWGRRTDRNSVGWWWLLFLAALGPIALGRIDSVTVPIAIVGVLFIATRPRTAAIVLTVAAWIKVWPGAVVIAMVAVCTARWRILAAAIGTSAFISAIALSYGSGWNLLGFVGQQTGRGLQIESPVATWWMWEAWLRVPGTFVYFDNDILTWQLKGTGVDIASAIMTPMLLVAVVVVASLGIVARRRGASATAVLAPLVLALLAGLIAFQKVGSPQFISWLAVPVILGLLVSLDGHGPSFRAPAAILVITAALTQTVYPYLYGYVISLHAPLLLVLTARNVLLFVLLGWAVSALIRAPHWTPPPARVSGDSAARRFGVDWFGSRDRDTVDTSTPVV